MAAGRYAIAREGEARERQGGSGRFGSLPIGDEPEYGKSVEKAAEKFGVSPPKQRNAQPHNSDKLNMH